MSEGGHGGVDLRPLGRIEVGEHPGEQAQALVAPVGQLGVRGSGEVEAHPPAVVVVATPLP